MSRRKTSPPPGDPVRDHYADLFDRAVEALERHFIEARLRHPYGSEVHDYALELARLLKPYAPRPPGD